MFVIKYDKVSMIKLVQSIEKHPAIYNTKKHYSKDEQDSAWDKVAIEVGEKDSLCRERWHSIRSCYIRHLKYTALNSSRRPYYLAEYLSYLEPYVSDRIKKFMVQKKYQINNLPTYLREALPQKQPGKSIFLVNFTNAKESALPQKPQTNSFFAADFTNAQESRIKEEIVDIEDVSDASNPEWLSIKVENQEPSSSKTSAEKQQHNTDSNSKKTTNVQVNRSNDEDVNFFKSLLPDIARMSSHQKLKFKQEALSIIEDILYATADDINITD